MSQRKPPKPIVRPRRPQGGRGGFGRRILWTVVMVVILGGAVAVAVDVAQPEPPPPPELEAVETFPDMGTEHLAVGSSAPVYNSDPPTSGPHAQTPAPCGIYRQPVPDVSQLHSLEHGAVVIQYDLGLPQTQVGLLESIDWSPADEIVLAPRPEIPAPVVLTAWTKILLLEEVDVDVVTAFEREFGNRSPEPAASCPFQVDDRR